MNAPRRVDRCNPDRARHAYEDLRANALGELNRAARLAMFLRDGMSAWLQALPDTAGAEGATVPMASVAAGELDADVPGAQLVSILTDAILAAGPVGCPGGTR